MPEQLPPANRRTTCDALSPPLQLTSIGRTRIPPPDETARAFSVVIADLATLNTHIAEYVLHHTDAYAGQSNPMSIRDELALAEHLATAAAQVCEQIRRREQANNLKEN